MKHLSSEYKAYINSAGWKKSLRRAIAFNLLLGQDVVFPFLKAHDIEHLSYKRINFKNCRGYEIPFLDLLPLNRVIHRQVVTPIKDVLRSLFGRKLGSAIVAYFLRMCLLFWYAIVLLTVVTFFSLSNLL
ncbi:MULTISPECIES: hypothetical protein [Leptolyngbya]|jgi:hypothetical protein|uniref:hypothetical protein n=1 Tax=Leptolyngbya TaxID=47251 RepID=UPI00036BA320|nr:MULTISPECIES: hypothetical protein [Leptolyngbya]MBD2371099.1 hypothetical protein [Leptolyngbya sp. FACHB-161]MBD2377567.1 hypothetical protein [Leptolyngbya sp. FACHB-238]MBD2402020.1 hypothetical protein [Leptolyngbya sp. FACHB-239]MBD2408539.1 hypothetical protein [Leptolyngbya sp. FACHB-402]BAS60439.1 hypothetical protein LBWT_Y0270 [Leptolyngbya boryana IAM M-101]